MLLQKKKALFEIASWLIAEVILNLVGLDNLANYSEFIFAKESIIASNHPSELVMTIPPYCRWIVGLYPVS
jgi:hypothetical protein